MNDEERILAAIDNRYCTAGQIRRRTGIDDVLTVLHQMESDRRIVKKENGYLVGYFRPEWVPERFYLDGNKVKFENTVNIGVQPSTLPKVNFNRAFVSREKPIDYDKLKALAASGITIKDVCRQFGIAEPTFYRKKNNDGKFMKAWEEGRKIVVEG